MVDGTGKAAEMSREEMMRQDRQGVRSPADIEQKYDLGAIVGLKKAAESSVQGLNKTNRTLEQFMTAALGSIENLKSQIDGHIMTWFHSGEPTLETPPAEDWSTDEARRDHLNDLYYDQETGYVYRFVVNDGVYSWMKLSDRDVTEALALANAAKDTADGKRRVFVDTPSPPYDCGDMWINEKEIYVCQISKGEGEYYVENDFIIATKYTDDTLAKQLGDTLEILRGTVTKIQENADSFRIDIETTLKSMDEQQRESIEELKRMSYAFGAEDFTIEKSGSEMKTRISEDGMRVYKNNEKVLEVNNAGVDALNLHAMTYLSIGKNSRFEDYGENRTGCFWIGGNS